MSSLHRLRSQGWFDNPDPIDMTAPCRERFMHYGHNLAQQMPRRNH